MNEFEKKPRRTVLKYGLSAIAILGVFAVAGSVMGVVTTPFRMVERTFTPQNIIQNYEWFKRQYQDVIAIDKRLEASEDALRSFETSAGSRDTWKHDDRSQWNRLNSIVLGLRGQRAAMVAEYNARTQMMNRDVFRTSDLPAELK